MYIPIRYEKVLAVSIEIPAFSIPQLASPPLSFSLISFDKSLPLSLRNSKTIPFEGTIRTFRKGLPRLLDIRALLSKYFVIFTPR